MLFTALSVKTQHVTGKFIRMDWRAQGGHLWMFSVVGEISQKCQSRAALAHWVLIVYIHVVCIYPYVWVSISMRRQGYKSNEVVAGRESLDEMFLRGQGVCEASVSAAFPEGTWIANLQNCFSRAPLSTLKSFKKYLQKRLVAILDHCMDTLWKIGKAGDAAHCTFKCPVKFPLHRSCCLGRIVLHTVETRCWREVDAVFQVFECDDFHLKTVNLSSAASRTLRLCVNIVCVRKQQVWQTTHSWKPVTWSTWKQARTGIPWEITLISNVSCSSQHGV